MVNRQESKRVKRQTKIAKKLVKKNRREKNQQCNVPFMVSYMLNACGHFFFNSCQFMRNLKQGEKREREKKEAFIISTENSETKPERGQFYSQDRTLLSRNHTQKKVYSLFI